MAIATTEDIEALSSVLSLFFSAALEVYILIKWVLLFLNHISNK